MADVDIGRLRLRGRPALAPKATFLIENACRTEIPDSDRLFLVRRLDLGRTPMRGPAAAGIVRRAYEMATQSASHGGEDSASAANCVWFASRAEARRLLLAAVLAGRRPSAWYWRLAVPGWRGQTSEQWLADIVPRALAESGTSDLLAIVTRIVEAGKTEALLRILASAACSPEAVGPMPLSRPVVPERPVAAASSGAPVLEDEDLRRPVERLRTAMAPALRETVEALVLRMGPSSRASATLLERLIVAASPSIALAPGLLHRLAAAYRAALPLPPPPGIGKASEASPPRAGELREPPRSTPAARIPEANELPRGDSPPPARPGRPAGRRDGGDGLQPTPAKQATAPPPAVVDADIVLPEPFATDECATASAGLWLVVPALNHMGLGQWLIERPELLCDDPGRMLLHRIAAHHRVAPDDPSLSPLGEARPACGPEWTRLWRVGLDRWLRRRTRISLHDLVWRAGFIGIADDRLTIRFPPRAADIRLRRRALDVDPGWTDWLGLSVRYAFADRLPS